MVTPRLIDGYKLKRLRELQESCLIGARGFEPPTPCSQGRCRLKQKEKRQGKGRKITVDSDDSLNKVITFKASNVITLKAGS